jgi:hypothetical protein
MCLLLILATVAHSGSAELDGKQFGLVRDWAERQGYVYQGIDNVFGIRAYVFIGSPRLYDPNEAAACSKGETIRNEPSPVTPERVYMSLVAADAFGRARLESNARLRR